MVRSLNLSFRVLFNVKAMNQEEKGTLLINPTIDISDETVKATGIKKEKLKEEGVPFAEAVLNFVNMVYEKVVSKQRTFKIATFGDWQLNYQLPIECEQRGIQMSPIF